MIQNGNSIRSMQEQYLSELEQIKYENNQTVVFDPIISQSFNETLPPFEMALAEVTECANSPKKPKH